MFGSLPSLGTKYITPFSPVAGSSETTSHLIPTRELIALVITLFSTGFVDVESKVLSTFTNPYSLEVAPGI